MAQKLVKHGSMAGYKAELKTDSVCDRCRNASRVYNTQYTKQGKAQNLKYGTYDVIDHLYIPGRNQTKPVTNRPGSPRTEPSSAAPPGPSVAWPGPDVAASDQAGPSLGDRLRDSLRGLVVSAEPVDNPYIPTDEYPDYIETKDPDPEPQGGDWSEPKPDDYVVTAEAITAVKDNLGMYLATVGMTLGIIDPYCGTAIRENLDDMVNAWARVISHYPGAVKIFTAKGGGKIMAWIDALMSTWPVLLAIYEHHLAKTVEIDNLGRAVRVTRAQQNGHFATQPDFDYTVE